MAALLFIWIIFFFLVCGAVVFLLCLLRAPSRRRALSAALWCGMFGPCAVGLLILAGFSVLIAAFAQKTGEPLPSEMPKFLSTLSWGYLTIGSLLTIGMASVCAWLHQAIIDRLPLGIFRLYATLVVAGIGSVFGWCLGLWRLTSRYDGTTSLVLWLLAMVSLILGFGFAAYKGASSLRTPRPLLRVTSDV